MNRKININPIKPLTTFEVSKICGVVHSTVSKWVDQGKLTAYRTPGGHRRIRPLDLMVFLKLYDMPIPEGLAGAAPEPDSRKKRILIVEDDASLLQTIAVSIQALIPGLEVHLAHDGFEAGTQLATLLPDIVILDLILPGMDGFKILGSIRSDKRFDKTRIIVVSGHDAPETRAKLDAAGKADDFLPKPLDLNVLKSRIISLIKE